MTNRLRAPRRVGAISVAAATLALVTGCGGGGGAKSVAGPAHGPAPSAPATAGYAAWPQAQATAGHTATSSTSGPQTGHIRWRAKLGNLITQGPSIGPDGTIYESNDAGTLSALDPANGHIRWSFEGGGEIGGDLSTTAAVLPDGVVVWGGPNNHVFGISPAGKMLWSIDVDGVPTSPVVASASEVYVMTKSGDLIALQVGHDTAARRWTIHLGDSSYASPAIRPDGVVETTVDDSLVAVRDTGNAATESWRYTVKDLIEVSPSVSATNLTILGTNDGNEYGIDPAGKEVWKTSIGDNTYSSPAVGAADTAYFGDNNGFLRVIDTTDGSVVHMLRAPTADNAGHIWTSPAIDARGNIYYGTTGGHILGYDAAGNPLFDVVAGGEIDSYPALSHDGALLIASNDGFLYSIGS